MQPLATLDFSKYSSRIKEILLGSDLDTVTAKSIRRQIQSEFEVDLTESKKEFDAKTIAMYQEMLAAPGREKKTPDAAEAIVKQEPVQVKQEKVKGETSQRLDSLYSEELVPNEELEDLDPATPAGSDSGDDGLDDDDMDGIIDFHSQPSSGRSARSSRQRPSAKKKSKRTTSGGGGFGFVQVAPELAAVIGIHECPRSMVIKKVWEYVKERNLQDPDDKKIIQCDELMQKFTGTPRLHMMKVSSAVKDFLTSIPNPNAPADGTPRAKRDAKKKTLGESSAGKGGAFNKLHALSPALSELIGVHEESRPQIVKKIWDYIKANDLQDPRDKRVIRNDEAMKKVFSKNKMNMFEMNKLIGSHLGAAGDFTYTYDEVKIEDGPSPEDNVKMEELVGPPMLTVPEPLARKPRARAFHQK
ncbi:hypothetical protein HDV03_000459 [Kappamyces sp. JEL0829]|nr:hypothetical protein HDV03_000459 [Kappamyces sp. JEL0829]